jgi:hypothetical protein
MRKKPYHLLKTIHEYGNAAYIHGYNAAKEQFSEPHKMEEAAARLCLFGKVARIVGTVAPSEGVNNLND